MKLFVEMDDEQYEKYKQLLNDELVSKKIGVINFLEETGFELVSNTQTFDIASQRVGIVKVYEKGKDQVTVKVWDDR